MRRTPFSTIRSATKRNSLVVIALVWLAAVIGGTCAMLAYATTPGSAGSPPSKWPLESRVSRDANQSTLVMFVHPHCPCSRASISELALLMAHGQGRVTAHVFFLKPDGTPEDWVRTDTWLAAAEIPGVTIQSDDDGAEARRFGVETSGDTLLYDAQGRLKFHGGITISRGHSGDNPGRDALQASLLGKPSQQYRTPVFGCGLFDLDPKKCKSCRKTAD